jgi:hypothetical protein
MRAINEPELTAIVSRLQSLMGARLQDVISNETTICLTFYQSGQNFSLGFELGQVNPVLWYQLAEPPALLKKKKPMKLYLDAHFYGLRVSRVEMIPELGRVFKIVFSPPEIELAEPEIEFQLIPHQANLIARFGIKSGSRKSGENRESSIAWNRPVSQSALAQSQIETAGRSSERIDPSDTSVDDRSEQPSDDALVDLSFAPTKTSTSKAGRSPESSQTRDWDEIISEWRGADQSLAPSSPRAQYQKQLDKKKSALVKMQADLSDKQNAKWYDLGTWLKSNLYRLKSLAELPEDFPLQFKPFLRAEKTPVEMIQVCFDRSKELGRKQVESGRRIELMQSEIAALEAKLLLEEAQLIQTFSQIKKTKGLHELSESKGRKYQLATDLEVYIGKSARDNLALLRKAKPHDYWLHIKDSPGAFGILRRNAGRAVVSDELQSAGRWVIEQSVKKSASELRGQFFEVLLAECRYVRPIKGDKIGRVSFTQSRTIRIQF